MLSNVAEVTAAPKRVFEDCHMFEIHSISPCSDGETFLSSDDLNIYWWRLDTTTKCFNVVDIKPTTIDAVTQVITTAQVWVDMSYLSNFER